MSSPARLRLALVVLALASLGSVACRSAGPWGYARSYAPLSEEEDAADGSRDYDPVMIEREPESWRGSKISVFGVVKSRSQAQNGAAYLTLSVRTLATRNLCDTMAEESCRVTVSDHEFALLHAVVRLRPEDALGKLSIGPGSLVRVIGKLTDNVDKNDGMHVLAASYYRHWPRNYFVTDADRDHMRM